MTEDWISLSRPDYGEAEHTAVNMVLQQATQIHGPLTAAFEAAFAEYLGRRHAISVSSSSIAMLLVLKAAGIGHGANAAPDEIIAPAFGWHTLPNAIIWSQATPVLADIDYWSQTLSPEKVAEKITDKTRAIIASNVNGHPADWQKLRVLAREQACLLIEDSTEAIGSRYQGALVGTFGDVSLFDFSQPSALCCGQGAMIVTDNDMLALKIRHYRHRRLEERASLSTSLRPALDAGMTELAAALGLIQLKRLPELLGRRKVVEQWYQQHISSFEGIKPPYIAPGVDEVHWMLYTVHLGTRFRASSRDAMVEDMTTERVESAAYCYPLHLQRAYIEQFGCRKGHLRVTEKVADRAISLPFHADLTEDQIAFIVKTAKDASINVGAGAAIYL